MGDHRLFSVDSRRFGPIPVSSVIGRAFIRYWPLGRFGLVVAATY
jgi:signal peptidase I